MKHIYFLIVFFLAVTGIFFSFKTAIGQEGVKEVLEEQEEKEESQELESPVIKAVYLTSWAAGQKSKIDYAIKLSKTKDINAVVIDIKDFSGYVAYDAKVPEVVQYGAKRIKIKYIDSVIERFHQEGIYVIARIVVFQDPVLAKARQDLAIYSKRSEGASGFFQSLLAAISVWFDTSKSAWMDPAAKEVRDYNIKIAKDAANRGFDEINFDYIRFPSDGDLRDMGFPVWDGKDSRREVIKEFFQELRKELPDVKLSVDVFGITTYASNDVGIGQILEDTFEYFDYVSPMVYPSHYAKGFLSYKNPAQYPYEVVKYSIENAQRKLEAYRVIHETDEIKIKAKFRPWLQAFNMGAFYTSKMIQAQIGATEDALQDEFSGFMLWNASSFYSL